MKTYNGMMSEIFGLFRNRKIEKMRKDSEELARMNKPQGPEQKHSRGEAVQKTRKSEEKSKEENSKEGSAGGYKRSATIEKIMKKASKQRKRGDKSINRERRKEEEDARRERDYELNKQNADSYQRNANKN
tara:strand:+ start:834 stop:1226 length:393 start_codon:yes stop_codon:yes gene_type:complete